MHLLGVRYEKTRVRCLSSTTLDYPALRVDNNHTYHVEKFFNAVLCGEQCHEVARVSEIGSRVRSGHASGARFEQANKGRVVRSCNDACASSSRQMCFFPTWRRAERCCESESRSSSRSNSMYDNRVVACFSSLDLLNTRRGTSLRPSVLSPSYLSNGLCPNRGIIVPALLLTSVPSLPTLDLFTTMLEMFGGGSALRRFLTRLTDRWGGL